MAESKIHVSWQGNMQFNAHTGQNHVIALDSERKHGGLDMGTRPVKTLLVALAGCTAMDVISILRKKRQSVTGLEVHATGQQADRYPRVYTDIELVFIVEGHDINPKAVTRSIELSQTKYCPVWSMLAAVANVTWRYEIRASEAEA